MKLKEKSAINTVGERVKFARKNAKLSQDKLGKLIGISQQAVGEIERNITYLTKYLPDIARVTGFRYEWIKTGTGEKLSSKRLESNLQLSEKEIHNIPIINIKQISNLFKNEVTLKECLYTKTLPIVGCSNNCFAYVVEGDAMVSPHGFPTYPPGCTIIVDMKVQPQSLDRVVALLDNNQAIFRQYVYEAGKAYLKPLNPQYNTIEINKDITCGVVISTVIQDKSFD